ncbi:hypothetical protein PIB30_037596 [Stylosanthes scabra]|uniref:Ubiquitin-like protease family profile domain-containing protein n=1 Tax=Stylosanthes scabra TaxID=79078 RepID=A0ABU6WFU6_9FABA|nr:hypothetical protein [Stylosanthes scabra]
MEPSSCIEMVMVSLVRHVLNREEVERYQRDVYCVPSEILTLMFETYGTNYLDKKMKKHHLVSSLKDQGYMELLDKEKLKTTSACNILDQLRVWAGVPSILKKNANTLQLRHVDVPKQPNPTDCGVYVMKWMELLDTAGIAGSYMFQTRYAIEEWDQDQLDEFRKEIVVKVLFSKHSTLRVEAMNQVQSMNMESITEARERAKSRRQTRPSAALKSPYRQPSTAELEKRHQ